MSQDKKILFFDIDGTLITNDNRKLFPESARRAIKMARENGHMTFINSGRVLVNIEDNIRDAGFDGYVCGCGTYIYADGRVLLHNELKQERCVEIAKKARECGMMAIFEHTGHTAYDKEAEGEGNKEILDYFRSMNRKLIDDIESPEFIFDKLAAWYNPNTSDVEIFKEFVKKDFNCIQREGSFLEVVPKGFSKATGIKFILDYYDIPLSNAYVFGDSNNDIEMLQYVPNSIAMGVSSPEVLAIASYQTDTVLNDGIYKAMEHFGVI